MIKIDNDIIKEKKKLMCGSRLCAGTASTVPCLVFKHTIHLTRDHAVVW